MSFFGDIFGDEAWKDAQRSFRTYVRDPYLNAKTGGAWSVYQAAKNRKKAEKNLGADPALASSLSGSSFTPILVIGLGIFLVSRYL
jgi:hypothetical protein